MPQWKRFSDIYDRIQKTVICPQCRGAEIKRILYGRPDARDMEMIQKGEAISGGCFVRPWQPDWHCAGYGHDWYGENDPAKVELEKTLSRIIIEK